MDPLPESILFGTAMDPTEKPLFQPHQILSRRYEILSRLGGGGMGDVWRAFDLKLRMDVALKSIRLGLNKSEDTLEHLRQEVRNAREVISPNVCRIFDLVEEGEHELISMEYIDGITLMKRLIEKGPMDLAEARDMAAQFLTGLEAIHKAGLVHCDFKPENIMITRTGRVVVMDFGIAKQAREKILKVTGTLPYMSPEHLSGNALDPRTDVFSAGVVLAEMIHPSGILSSRTRNEIWDILHDNPLQLPESPWKLLIARAVAPYKEDRFPSAAALAHALEEATERMDASEERNPYPGLSSFSAADSDYFFGRELEVETLLKKSQQLQMIAVVGPSGAGKTSFLRAGFIPVLPENWGCIFCVPGESPFINLAQSLIPEISRSTESMQRILKFQDLKVAMEFLREWRMKYAEALLIIDRFEELFTLNPANIQAAFIQLIATAALEADVRILISMRDDFLLRCHDHPSLDPIFSALMPISALTGPALRRALVQPALKCGYRFEDETLVDQILSDVENERGTLPLMAFAAARLWSRRNRESGELTRVAYRQIGGVAGALAQHAEETMDRIGMEKQQIVREVFRNLITAENTRVARDTEELLSIFSKRPAAEEVLRILVDARLLTTFEAPAEEGEVPKRRVEIIHESLLTAWPRLVRWQTQDADSAQLRDQLRQAAQLWERKNRSDDFLWTGAALLEFQAWRERYTGGLTSTELAFEKAMVARAEKKRKQKRIASITLFVILFAVSGVLAFFWHNAKVAKDQAVLEARRADASKLLTIGRAADPGTKVAYALASLEKFDTFEGRAFAIQALSTETPPIAMKLTRSIDMLDISPDGQSIVYSDQMGVWLLERDAQAPPFQLSNRPAVRVPRFSPDGDHVLWMNEPTKLHLWSIPLKRSVLTLEMEGSTSFGIRLGKVLLTTSLTSEEPWESRHVLIQLWDVREKSPRTVVKFRRKESSPFVLDPKVQSIAVIDGSKLYLRSIKGSNVGEEPQLVGVADSKLVHVQFHPGANAIATADANGEIRIWSLNRSEPIRVIPSRGFGYNGIFFDSQGSYLAAVLDKKEIYLWDLKAPYGTEPRVYNYLQEYRNHAIFDSQSRWLIVAWRSALAFYPLTHDYPHTFRGTGWGAFNVLFTPDGNSLISGFNDDGIQIWRMPGQEQKPPVTLWPPEGKPQPIAIDRDGRFLVVGTSDATQAGVFLMPLAGENVQPLIRSLPRRIYDGISISNDSKFVAAVGVHEPFEDHGIEIWNLHTGEASYLKESKGMASYTVRFSPNGKLYSGDLEGHVYEWNLNDGSRKTILKGKGMVSGIAITNDGRYLAACILSVPQWGDIPVATSELMLFDRQLKTHKQIASHGNRIFSVAFDPKSQNLVTGDIDGVVRVGPIDDGTPHILMGHTATVSDVTVHPNGKWIASTEIFNPEVRLWPMPTGDPFIGLPHLEFLNRLRSITNVRVIPDSKSSNGYSIEFARFPGWKEVPSW